MKNPIPPAPRLQGTVFASATLLAVVLTVVPILGPPPTFAQDPGEGQEEATGDTQTLVLTKDTRSLIRLAFPETSYDPSLTGEALESAREIEQTLRSDLEQSFVFNVQGPTELSVLALTGVRERDFELYRSLGNEVVLLTEVRQEAGKLVLDGWIYDLPSQQSVLGKRFRGTLDQPRQIAHYLADAAYFQFTGRPSIFLTTIVFQSDRSGRQELYLMDYDGHNQRRISGHRSTTGYADWSPTGDAIAYMSYYTGSPGIYYVDVATGEKVPVYRDGPLNLSPSFSPDGERIAFASAQRGSNVDLFVCPRSCNQPRRLTTSGAIDTNPAWSPDGTRIAFTSSRSGRPNVYVMDADGSGVRRISFDGDYNEGASWRPDGSHLVYASRQRGYKFQIAATDLVDLETRILTSGPDSYEEPTFAPDGRRIAFTVRRGGGSQIFVMNADGTDWRQLTHEGKSSAPDWSAFPQK